MGRLTHDLLGKNWVAMGGREPGAERQGTPSGMALAAIHRVSPVSTPVGDHPSNRAFWVDGTVLTLVSRWDFSRVGVDPTV